MQADTRSRGPLSGKGCLPLGDRFGRKAAVASAAVLRPASPTCDLHHGQDASDFTRSRRYLMADKRGLETLEYAVFAVGFIVIIGGVVTALSTQLKVAYGRYRELDRPPSEVDLIPPRLVSLSRRPGHTSVKLTRRSCSSPRIETRSLAAGPWIFPIRSLRLREFSFGIGSCAARLHRRAGGAPQCGPYVVESGSIVAATAAMPSLMP